jgi:hypothetical protein
VSLPDSESTRPQGVLIRKPKATVYVALLGVAVAALAIGCLLLVLELSTYGLFGPPWSATGR